MSRHSHQLGWLALIVSHLNSSKVDVGIAPPAPLNFSQSHVLNIWTALYTVSERPSLDVVKFVAYGRILVDLTVAHHCKSKLPWLLVTFAQTFCRDSDEHIILLELDFSSFGAFSGINYVRWPIAIDDFKATQVFIVFLIDSDLLYGWLLKVNLLKFVP